MRDRYHRPAPFLPQGTNVPLDAVKTLPQMVEFALGVDISDTAAWQRQY